MKKLVKLFCVAFVAMLLSSCDENVSKVKDVVNQFVEGVNSKDKVTIFEMYPNIRNFTNLQLPDTIKIDGMKVEFDEKDSVYLARINDKQTLVCIIDSAGITISDSYNVLKLDSTCYDLAAKTGFPVKQMSDMTVGQMFSDEGEFASYLQLMYPSAANGNLSANGGYYRWGRDNTGWYMRFDTTVSNYGENPVKGADYFVEISYFRRDTGSPLSTKNVEQGVDLAPGESYVYTTNKPELWQYNPNNGSVGSGVDVSASIKFKNTSKAVMLNKYGSFTGKEYEEFVALQKEKEKAETEKPEANDSIKAEVVE